MLSVASFMAVLNRWVARGGVFFVLWVGVSRISLAHIFRQMCWQDFCESDSYCWSIRLTATDSPQQLKANLIDYRWEPSRYSAAAMAQSA